MVIQELKPSKRVRGRWLAVLEDGSLLRVGEGEVIQFALCAGRELTEEEGERLQAAVRTGGLKEKALNLPAGSWSGSWRAGRLLRRRRPPSAAGWRSWAF